MSHMGRPSPILRSTSGFVLLAASVLLLNVSASTSAEAQSYLPSMKFPQSALVPTNTTYYSGTTHTTTIWAPPRASEIKALARGLGASQVTGGQLTQAAYAQRVDEYLYNNVRTEFMFGAQKGALGALIDQAGTPFDIAALQIELLSEANISAAYQYGTITLSGTQFDAWTGITIPAVACRLMSDGGIPADVTPSTCATTGSVSSVKLLTVWVSALGNQYYPAYKTYTTKTGMSLATVTGCSGSGCVTTLTGYVPQPAGTIGGASYVQNINQAGLETKVGDYARNLLTAIRGAESPSGQPHNPLAVEDVVGGRIVDPSGRIVATTLPFSPASMATWSAIPDAFRIKLRVQFDNFNTSTLPPNQQLYMDEIYGLRLQVRGKVISDNPDHTSTTRDVGLFLEFKLVASSHLVGGTETNGDLTLAIDHPYAASSGTYMDDTVTHKASFQLRYPSGVTVGGSVFYINPFFIQVGLGSVASDAVGYFSDLMNKNRYIADVPNVTQFNNYSDCGTYSCFLAAQTGTAGVFPITTSAGVTHWAMPGVTASPVPIYMATFQSQTSRMLDLIGQVNGVRLMIHHTLGSMSQLRSSVGMNVESSLNAISTTANAADEKSARFAAAAVSSRLEGSLPEQTMEVWDGFTAISMLARSNEPGHAIPLLRVTSSNYLTAIPQLLNYPTEVKNALNAYFASAAGNEAILPRNWHPGTWSFIGGSFTPQFNGLFAYNAASDHLSYLLGGFSKGGAGIGGLDPAQSIQDSVKQTDASAKARKYYGVDVSNGALNLSPPPDIVTGSGEFPYSLSFRRTYNSKGNGLPFEVASYVMQGSFVNPALSFDRGSALGGGWDYNFNIRATMGSDTDQAMGEDSALDAATTIAALHAVRTLNTGTQTLQTHVATMFVVHAWANTLLNNAVVVSRPPSRGTFLRLADTTFNPPPGSAENLQQSGNRTGPYVDQQGTTGYFYDPLSFALTDADGSIMNFNLIGGQSFGNRRFGPTAWSFSNGVRVAFEYATVQGISGPLCLNAISNNLGRRLSLTLFQHPFELMHCTVLRVQDESTTRTVQYSGTSKNLYTLDTNDINLLTNYEFNVTLPDGGVTKYRYRSTAYEFGAARENAAIETIHTPSSSTSAFLSLQYDDLFRVKTLTDAGNNTSNYFVGALFNEPLHRGETLDPLGARTTAIFDRFGRALQTVDALGRTTTSVYDARQRLTRSIFPELNEERYEYDVRSNRTKVTQRAKPGSTLADLVTTTTYVEGSSVFPCVNAARCNKPARVNGPRTDVTDITTYSYNTSGTLARVMGPAVTGGNAQTDLCYTSIATPAIHTNPAGSVSLLTGVIDKVSSTVNRVAAYAYNTSNKFVLQSATVDPATTLTPPGTPGNACGTVSKSGALALTTKFTFDAIGNVQTINGPRTDVTDVTDYKFDSMRRLTTLAAPLGAMTRHCYDSDGLLKSTHRARQIGFTDPNASTSTTTGQCSSGYATNQWQSESRTYWATGDLKSITDVEGNQTQYAYDAAGRTTLVTDADNRRLGTVYDLAGQSLCTWKGWNSASAPTSCSWNPASYANGGPLRYAHYTYTNNGKQLTVQDAGSNTTKYIYDAHDRLKYALFPNAANGVLCADPTSETADPACTASGGTTPTYEKSVYGDGINRTSLRTRKAETTTFAYDAANRLITKSPPGQGAVTYGYNLLSESTSIAEAASGSNAAYTVSYGYDGAGRKLTEQTGPIAGTARQVSFQWDQAGNRSRTTWPDGYYVTYDYDALNRMTTVKENGSTEIGFYDYDPLSQRTKLRFAGSEGNKLTYAYEPDGDLNVLTNVLNATAVTLDYAHNGSHQITSIGANDDFYLARPGSAATTAYVPNKLNQYSSIGGSSTAHDASGNLTSWISLGAIGGTHTYTYDSENRLVTAVANSVTTSYDYDPLGRRAKKTVGGTHTHYLSEGDEEIAEYDNAGTLLRRYVTGGVIDERIVHVEVVSGTGYKSFYHTNHQGSVVAMSDAAGNTGGCATNVLCQTLAYDEYGNLTSQPPAVTTGEAYRYTGRRYDPETGLYYYRARYYSPTLGRFLQTDPVGYEDDVNLYAYVSNDPLNNFDPTGNGLVTTGVKFIAKGGDIAATTAGMVDDATTIINPAVPLPGRIGAALSLASELAPVSARDVKAGVAILENTARGRASEARKLAEVGATKNTDKAQTSFGDRIRDGTKQDGTHVEVKDTKRLDATQQLRGLDEAAGKEGQRLEVYTGTNTKVSGNVNEQTLPNTRVIQCTDLGPCK